MLGGKVKIYLFDYRLPEYEKVVNRIKVSRVNYVGQLVPVLLEKDENHLAYKVLATREKGVLYVEFYTGRGFPVKHSGYIYSESQGVAQGAIVDQRWPEHKRWKLNDNWFGFSG